LIGALLPKSQASLPSGLWVIRDSRHVNMIA